MTNIIYIRRAVSLALILWAAALPVFALGGNAGGSGCTGTCLENPLRFPTLERFIEGTLQAIVMIALPVIVAFMVYAGFKYIMAQGNPNKINDAHRNFGWLIAGAALILGAWVFATLIGATVTQILRG